MNGPDEELQSMSEKRAKQEEEVRTCPWCLTKLNPYAIVCAACSRSQRRLAVYSPYIGVGATVVLILAALWQFSLSSGEASDSAQVGQSSSGTLKRAGLTARLLKTVVDDVLAELVEIDTDQVKAAENQIIVLVAYLKQVKSESTKQVLTNVSHSLQSILYDVTDKQSFKIAELQKHIAPLLDLTDETNAGLDSELD